MKKILFCLLLVATLATSCMNEDDATPVVIYVTPNAYEASANSKIYFDITSKTINETITLFEVSTFDKDNGSKIVYSTKPSSKQFVYRFEYTVPNYAEDQTVEFTFSATDNINNRQDIRIPILVHGNATSINELTGIAIYSPRSGKSDAFSFKLQQSVNTKTAADEEVDIYVKPLEDEGSDLLSGSWASKTGVRFSKVNGFNYAAATLQSVAAIFPTLTTEPEIGSLAIGDIIFVGRDNEAIAVIRVANIYDSEGVSEDRYDVNMKIVASTTPEETPPTQEESETPKVE